MLTPLASRPSLTGRDPHRPRDPWRLLLLDEGGASAEQVQAALAGIAQVEQWGSAASATAALKAGIEAMEPYAAAVITADGDCHLDPLEQARALWAASPELELALVAAESPGPERFARPQQVTILQPPVDGEQLRAAVAGAQARFARRVLARAAGERARLSAQIAQLEGEAAQRREEDRAQRENDTERARAEKLASLGRLAAGLAHELNTPLQFVGDNLTFLAESFTSLGRLLESHQALHREVASGLDPYQAVRRAAEADSHADLPWVEKQVPLALAACSEGIAQVRDIVRTMKEFALPADMGRPDCDVNEAVRRAIVVARLDCDTIAAIEANLEDVPRARCSPDDLHHVLFALIVNAAQAIAERLAAPARGTIRLATRLRDEHVVITVTDDGCGIPEHVRPRIFEHFFTTREVGRGTGQGLAVAWSLVAHKYGGALRFETEVGRGTTFEVSLLRHD